MAEKDAAVLASVIFVCERLSGDCNESMDVAGETPSERYERRRLCYKPDYRLAAVRTMVPHGRCMRDTRYDLRLSFSTVRRKCLRFPNNRSLRRARIQPP